MFRRQASRHEPPLSRTIDQLQTAQSSGNKTVTQITKQKMLTQADIFGKFFEIRSPVSVQLNILTEKADFLDEIRRCLIYSML